MTYTDILNYKIIRLIGSGGMGSVYLAANVNIDQLVAIKVIRPEYARNSEIRAKFKKEAELLCSLDHPGIVKFLNYVETENGLFLIMEYVKGMTLKDFIEKKNGLIVESRAYPMIKEILNAFSYAHSKGIIHCDIKPSNIMVDDEGHLKIMDFGIAQIISDARNGNGISVGTPAYMSPEQVYGKAADERSDIYSLGVLMFTMLTGKTPYDSTKLTEHLIKSKVVKEGLPRLIEYYPHISDKIQKVVDKATKKDPAMRYSSCSEMDKDVKKAMVSDPIPRPLMYGGITFILACLIGGFFVWDYYRTKYEYYTDYSEIWGVPKGIHKLSGNEVRHREGSYKFEKSKGKVRRVSYVNSLGNLISHHESEEKDRIVDMSLTYVEGTDKVDTETFRDRSGRVLYVKDFDSNLKTCTFKLNDEFGTEMTLNSQVELFQSSFDSMLEGKSRISKYILHYDDDGLLEKVEYAGFGNVRVSDGQGIFGKSYVYDSKGRIIEESYLGKDGKLKATNFGLGKKKFSYNDKDCLAVIEYLTPENNPSSDGNNCPVIKYEYDKWGNRVSEKYYDTEGKLTLRKDNLTSGVSYEYNDRGFLVKMSNIGLDGGITYSNGVAGEIIEYDENGYPKTISYIDANGNGAIYNDEIMQYRMIELVNDEHGNPLEIKYLDLDKKPIESTISSGLKRTYDNLGRLTSEYFTDTDGNIFAPARLGYAGVEYEYNEQGRQRKVSLKDKDMKGITPPDLHYCYYIREYDARGNITEISYFDNSDKPALTYEGLSSIIIEYDDEGNEVSRKFLDTKKNPIVPNDGCAKVNYTYDDQGNRISERYEDPFGRPMFIKGNAGWNYEYDERGNIIVTYPVGLNGKMLAGGTRLNVKYDDRDNQTELTYFDALGKPKLNDEGTHKIIREYDDNNNIIRSESYGTDGKLKNIKGQGYAIVIAEFDSRNNQLSSTFFDASGKRGYDMNNVHKYYNEYDKIVNKVNHQLSFGVDGKPTIAVGVAPEGRIQYDKKGNMLKIITFDGYGKKFTGNRGWSETRYTYNDAGDRTSQSYFSIDGKPVNDKLEGYHKKEFKYNNMRLIESETVFNTSNKPMLNSSGYSTVKYKYDKQNRQIEKVFLGTRGEAVDCRAGYHREVYHYRNGAIASSDIYDKANRKIATGKVINNKWEYKLSQSEHDWRREWRIIASSCPINMEEGVVIKSIKIDSSKITVSIKLTGSIENGETDFSNDIKQAESFLRANTGTPSNIEIRILLYDKNNQILN